MLLPHLLRQEAVAHAHGGLEGELLAVLHLGVGHAVVDLLQREHAEGDVAGLVAHHVAQQLLEQRLLGHLVHEAERGQRQALDHHLHAEVGHVPAAVVDDVVEQHPQVGVDLVAAAELLVEVAGEDLDVAGLVDDLRGGVELGVVPRHGLDDLGRAQQRALLAVQELRQRPACGSRCRTRATPSRPTSRRRCRRRWLGSRPAAIADLVARRRPSRGRPRCPTAGRWWRSTGRSWPSRTACAAAGRASE